MTPPRRLRRSRTASSSACERRARVAVGARGEELERVVGDRRAAHSPRSSARRSSARCPAARERVQLVDLRARQQRRVDLEVRVLGRGPDERHEPLLDGRQQRVLLGLVEAVDLVEEEDRRLAARPARRCAARSMTPRTSARPACTALQLLERGVGEPATIRASVVLPVPGGP